MVEFKDEAELDTWDEDGNCNKIKGTDGTIFPPNIKRSDGIWAFVPDLCRSIETVYEKPSSYVGLPASRFILKIGDMRENGNECYCRDAPDFCPLFGTIDLKPCVGAPLVASLPHFYDADPVLLKGVDGLSPDVEKHGTEIDFELVSCDYNIFLNKFEPDFRISTAG